MTTRVYRFGARMPVDRELVVAQLRAAHDYQNQLTEIERGRRDAMRALYDTPEIRDAEALLKQVSKSDRKAAKRALSALRRDRLASLPRDVACSWCDAGGACSVCDGDGIITRAKEINALAHDLQVGARALTRCYWGSYLDVESRAQQARAMPLYDEDGLAPSAPKFRRWEEPMRGQIGVQIQATKPLTWGDILRGQDTRVRVERRDGPFAMLWIRIGSDGRDPVWARVPIKMHREVPNAARVSWVRVSCKPLSCRDKPEYRERWSVEITADDPAPAVRSLDTTLDGAIAVSWSWDVVRTSIGTNGAEDGQAIRAASWRDTRGASGEVLVPESIVKGIRKPDGIRAVRDMIWNDAQPKIARAMKRDNATSPRCPKWLSDAAATLHLWRSLGRVHELTRRMRADDSARGDAYALLLAWEDRDRHLWDYERNARDEALRERREMYRVLAAQWARRYKIALLSDQDLSREARFGDDADVRFTVSPDQLRGALKNAFGDDWIEAAWRKDDKTEPAAWCERVCSAYLAGGARADMFAPRKEKTANAWASRKKKKAEKNTARREAANAAE